MELDDKVAKAIIRVFESPNVSDKNMENANVVDVLDKISDALNQIAIALNKEKS